jgi:hypothetical protein
VLQIIMILGLLTAAGVGVHWTLTRVDTLGRRRSFPVIGTAVPLVVAVAAGVPVLRHAQLEARLAAVASTLVGHHVTVRCETLTQAWTDAHPEAGYVWFDAAGRPATSATLTSSTCDDLKAWLGSDRQHPSLSEIVAVHVLTHESMHMSGWRDEAKAECAAVQRDARTAVLLGATPEKGSALAVAYWREIYPDLTDAYRTADCAAGGADDEGLPDAPWAGVKSS